MWRDRHANGRHRNDVDPVVDPLSERAGASRASRRRWPPLAGWITLSLAAIAVVAGLPAAARHVPSEALATALQQSGLPGLALFVASAALATAVGLPRQLVALIAGYAWGIGVGLLLAVGASLAGCLISMVVAGHFFQAPLRRRHAAMLARLEHFFARDLFLKTLVLRLQPFGTNLLSNLAAGVLGVDRRVYLAASLIGYLPQALVFVLVGSGLRVGSSTELLVSAGLFAVSLALGGVLWRRHVVANGVSGEVAP